MNTCALCSGKIPAGYTVTDDHKPAHSWCLKRYRRQQRETPGLDTTTLEPLDADDHAALATRPKTWGECRDNTGPCVWVGCRYHLGIEVTEHGRLVLCVPEPTEMAEPCALRVAERGDHDGPALARLLGVTRQRVQQLEIRAVRKLRFVEIPR